MKNDEKNRFHFNELIINTQHLADDIVELVNSNMLSSISNHPQYHTSAKKVDEGAEFVSVNPLKGISPRRSGYEWAAHQSYKNYPSMSELVIQISDEEETCSIGCIKISCTEEINELQENIEKKLLS